MGEAEAYLRLYLLIALGVSFGLLLGWLLPKPLEKPRWLEVAAWSVPVGFWTSLLVLYLLYTALFSVENVVTTALFVGVGLVIYGLTFLVARVQRHLAQLMFTQAAFLAGFALAVPTLGGLIALGWV